jgi:hypothetical protein
MSVEMIPLKYYLQIQFYLEIVGSWHGILFSWTPNNSSKCYHLERDPYLWMKIKEDLFQFYTFMLNKEEPPKMSAHFKAMMTDLVHTSLVGHTHP